MANTAHSHIMAATVIDGIPTTIPANPAATSYTPADWGYFTATKTITAIVNTTAICKLSKPLLMEFRPRVSTANARYDCDDAYASTSDIIPIILGARGIGGPITTVAKITDPGGTKYKGHTFMVGGTAGDIALTALEATGATSGTAFRNYMINGFNPEDLANGDTYMKFTWW